MAFKGYELNLMLRVQDRASTRLRRVASDIGGVNRAAQMQRDAQRLSSATTRTNTRLEQELAAERLLGLKKSNTELASFNNHLNRSVKLGRITADESKIIAKNYERIGRAQQLVSRGRSIAHAGSITAMGGGLALAALGGASASFANFDTQAVKAATQTGAVGEDFNKTVARARGLEKALIGLSMRFPATASQMAESSYDIYSSIDLTDKAMQKNLGTTSELGAGLRLLTEANKIAVGGQTDLNSATNTLITVLNNFDPIARHVNQTMDEMFTIIRFGRMDFAEFGNLMNSLAPAAKKSQQSLLDVGAAAAILTKFIPSQSQVGTSISRLLDVFSRKDFQEGFAKLGPGFEITDKSGKLKPLYDIITNIVKLNPGLKEGGSDLNNLIKYMTAFGRGSGQGIDSTLQARKALVMLITGYDMYGNVLKKFQTTNGEYQKSFEALSQSYGVRWQVFKNQLSALVLVIGEQAIPMFIRFGSWLQGLAERWRGLSSHTRGLIVKITALVAVFMLVGGIVATVAGGIMSLVGLLGLMSGGAALAATGWIGLGIAAGIAALLIIKNFDTVKKWWHAFWNISFSDVMKAGLISSLGNIKLFVAAALTQFAALATGIANIPGVNRLPGVKSGANKLENMVKGLAESGLKDQAKAARILRDSFQANLESENAGSPSKGKNKNTKNDKDKLTFAEKVQKFQNDMTKDYLAAIKAQVSAEENGNKKIAAYNKALAKQKISALHSAQEAQKTDIKQYTDTLVNTFKTLEEAAKSSFGELFQGNVSQGPLGQIYSTINDTIMKFGGKPIATPISILNKDLESQMQNFEILRKDYATLLKRGASKEFVQELQAQGMGALSQVEGLANANPTQLQGYLKMWKGKKEAITAAAKSDMDMTLAIWKDAGKGIAWQIVQGLASDPSQALLREGFQKYVVSTFGQELKTGLNKQVQDAITQWKKENPKPSAKTKKTTPIVPITKKGSTTVNGDNITVVASGATTGAVTAALNKGRHVKRHTK